MVSKDELVMGDEVRFTTMEFPNSIGLISSAELCLGSKRRQKSGVSTVYLRRSKCLA